MITVQENLEELLEAVQEADRAVMDVYASPDFGVELKADKSPVTKADIAAHDILLRGLAKLFPDIPVVSEEDEGEKVVTADRFWLVDPVDGTREFIARTGEFTICAALIEDNRPVFGIVSAPALGRTYYGGPDMGSFRKMAGEEKAEQIHVSGDFMGLKTIMRSRDGLTDSTRQYVKDHYLDYRYQVAGSQLKFTLIAEGRADVYPRLESPLHLWDVAPGHAILSGAGGLVTRLDGSPIDYHAANLNVPDFIAQGCQPG